MKWKSKKKNGKFVAIAMLVQRSGLAAGLDNRLSSLERKLIKDKKVDVTNQSQIGFLSLEQMTIVEKMLKNTTSASLVANPMLAVVPLLKAILQRYNQRTKF